MSHALRVSCPATVFSVTASSVPLRILLATASINTAAAASTTTTATGPVRLLEELGEENDH